MSLFDKLNNKRYELQEKRKQRDNSYLFDDGDNIGKKKKYTPPSKEKSDAIQSRSANRDAKKYASGEYPKIGGGDRMTPKSKGPGASTGGTKIPTATVGGKSKGTTPVKVNITKPVKQSEISKKAKVFTQKIDKKKITKDADRLVRKAEKGDKAARKQIFKTVTKRFKKLSPADQEIQLTKMADIQKKMGRTFNPKTGNFEGPDTKFQKSLSKIKDSKGKRITSGPVSVTAGPDIRKRVEKIRDTRATKAGMPDPFKSKTKAQTKFDDIFKGAKKTKKFKLGGKTQFDISKTPVGKIKLPPKKVSPEVQKKTFDKFTKEISDATKQTKKVSKKIGSIKSPKMPSQPETGFGGTPGSKPTGGTKTVKQSEVSKQAKDFTQKINQKKTTNTAQKMSTVKGDPLQGNFDYDTSTKSTPKPKKPNVFKRVTAATSGKKGSALNPEISGIDFDVPKKTPPINVTGTSGGGGKKPPVKRKTGGTGANKPRKPRKITKKLVSPGVAKVSAAPKATKKITKMLGGSSNVDFYKSGSKLAKGISKVSPKAGKLALGATKTLAKLGTPGRIAATVGTVAALSPAARKGISGLAKQALAGAGLGGVVGASAASQKQSDKARIKAKKLPVFKDEILDKKGKQKFPNSKKVARMGLNLSDISKPKKDKARTSQSIATEVDYLKKRQKVAPYGAKYTG